MKVMAHEGDPLATSSRQNQRPHSGGTVDDGNVAEKRHRGSGRLRAYRCADGFVGTYEEVLLHSQKIAFLKRRGWDTSLPIWWSHWDSGASNRRVAATRVNNLTENSMPTWWSHWDHGASNRRKAAVRVNSTDDGLPVWWSL